MMKSTLKNMIIGLGKKIIAAALTGAVIVAAMPGMKVEAKTKKTATVTTATVATAPETFAATTAGTTLPASVAGLDSIVLPCNDGTGNPRTYPITDSAFQQVQNTMCMATIVIGNPTVAQQMLQQNIAMTQTILNNTAAVYMSCGFDAASANAYALRYFQNEIVGVQLGIAALTAK